MTMNTCPWTGSNMQDLASEASQLFFAFLWIRRTEKCPPSTLVVKHMCSISHRSSPLSWFQWSKITHASEASQTFFTFVDQNDWKMNSLVGTVPPLSCPLTWFQWIKSKASETSQLCSLLWTRMREKFPPATLVVRNCAPSHNRAPWPDLNGKKVRQAKRAKIVSLLRTKRLKNELLQRCVVRPQKMNTFCTGPTDMQKSVAQPKKLN